MNAPWCLSLLYYWSQLKYIFRPTFLMVSLTKVLGISVIMSNLDCDLCDVDDRSLAIGREGAAATCGQTTLRGDGWNCPTQWKYTLKMTAIPLFMLATELNISHIRLLRSWNNYINYNNTHLITNYNLNIYFDHYSSASNIRLT